MQTSSTTPRERGSSAARRWSLEALSLFASLLLAGPSLAYPAPDAAGLDIVLPAASAIGAGIHLAQAQPASSQD